MQLSNKDGGIQNVTAHGVETSKLNDTQLSSRVMFY